MSDLLASFPLRFRFCCPVLSLLALLVPLQAQVSLEQCRTLWAAQKYQEASEALAKYRDQRNGKTVEVDYMLGTCLCRMNKPEVGKKVLGLVAEIYPLSEEELAVIRKESEVCGQSAIVSTRTPPTLSAPRTRGQARFVSRGKGGYVLGDTEFGTGRGNEDSAAFGSQVAPAEISPAMLQERLFALDQATNARTYFEKLLAPHFSASEKPVIFSRGAFTFIFRPGIDIPPVLQMLERVMKFYETEYGMTKPDRLITVYLAQNRYNLARIAEKIHGLRQPGDLLGYSVFEDLSMVGIVPSAEYSGTLSHELFHLMVRGNFGDIPPWLEEGISSAYSVAGFAGERLLASRNNWRKEVLQRFLKPGDRLSVEQIVHLTWGDFTTKDTLIRRAVNNAIISYFALYLQEKGKLATVYQAYRERKFPDEMGDPLSPLLKAYGESTDVITRDFWRFTEEIIR